ncbi:hypothetical protein FQN57_003902 [Myotisia sp. PD_48]|nr:hypothetical protein FQN57_003902 [Myotisia sp. PD_48]
MPPRLRTARQLTSNLTSHNVSSSSQPLPSLYISSSCPSSLSSPFTPSECPFSYQSPKARSFSTTPVHHLTKLRRDMANWLNGPGVAFKHPLPGSTNYLSAYDRRGKLLRAVKEQPETGESQTPPAEDDAASQLSPESQQDLKPFPLNPTFVSQRVLSEELRNEIYDQVVTKGHSVRHVSVLFGVDMRRVGAVVRLLELEKKWRQQRKPLALPYARAVHEMLPTTPLIKAPRVQIPHEPINDLPVHRLTEPQIFYPTSESRHFTRVDAARVFSAAPSLTVADRDTPGNTAEAIDKITHNHGKIEFVGKGDSVEQVLQPADVRIPHPHLVSFEHDAFKYPGEAELRQKAFFDRLKTEEAVDKRRRQRKLERESKMVTKVEPPTGRFQFRFRDVEVSREVTGMNGRGEKAVGRRYGVPHDDRKRGVIKIPTKVEV